MSFRHRISREQLRSARPLLVAWLASRALLLLFLYNIVPYIDHFSVVGDVQAYNKWSLVFAHGHFPVNDPQWQYPPGASVFMILPRLAKSVTGMSYYSAFYLMALLCDLVVFLLVLAACRRTAAKVAADGQVSPGDLKIDYTGAWAYLAAIFALGPMVFARYDICVTMVATIALVLTGRTAVRTWRMRGAAIGVGAIMKVWPALLLFGLPKRSDGRRALVWTVIGAVVPTLILMAALPGALGFLREQGDRGLEIESVPAMPFMIARHFGYPGTIKHAYGAFEIVGPGLGLISTGCELLTLAGLAWLLVWRRKANLTPGRWSTGLFYDASLVAVLISIITSRVLSPQYLIWVVGLIALCLTLTPLGRNGTVLARQCWMLLAAISVTQIEFPWLFPRLVEGSIWAALLVGARDLLLVVATWQAARALWRAAAANVPARADEPVGEPVPQIHPEPAPPQLQGVPDQVS